MPFRRSCESLCFAGAATRLLCVVGRRDHERVVVRILLSQVAVWQWLAPSVRQVARIQVIIDPTSWRSGIPCITNWGRISTKLGKSLLSFFSPDSSQKRESRPSHRRRENNRHQLTGAPIARDVHEDHVAHDDRISRELPAERAKTKKSRSPAMLSVEEQVTWPYPPLNPMTNGPPISFPFVFILSSNDKLLKRPSRNNIKNTYNSFFRLLLRGERVLNLIKRNKSSNRLFLELVSKILIATSVHDSLWSIMKYNFVP